MDRFENHCHFEWSNERLYDSINRLESITNRALELGLKGIAVTDHGTVAGHIKANKLQMEIQKEHPDFKIALGEEGYLVDERESGIKYYHFIWIAKDKVGQKQIRILSSLGWLNGYADRGMFRVPVLKEELERIVSADPGHLIVTTACIGGEVSSNILDMEIARKIGDVNGAEVAKQKIIDFILWAKNLFGEDFYLEVAPAKSKEQIIVNKKMVELSKIFNVKMVIGCDAHYCSKADRYVHKAFLESEPKNRGNREVDAFYEYAYLQSEEEIIDNLTPSIVDMYEEMCRNSMEMYDKIENYSLLHPQQIPKVDVIEYPKPLSKQGDYFESHYPILSSMLISDNKIERYWVNECIKKLNDLDKNNEEYLSRLEEEADIKRTISEKLDTNFFAYPVVLQHYIDLIWSCGSTVGAGRGSSCSGLNHYLLGVTQLDPIEYNLPFWRYSNKERIELGDIDIDIAPSKRPKILNEIKKERGEKFYDGIDEASRKNLGCTLVATFGTQSSKSAILTACRGYRSKEYPNGIDTDTAQYLSSLVPQERGFIWSLSDMVYGNPDKGRKPSLTFINEVNLYPGLLEIMQGIEGLISSRGSHASGVILFDEDPYEFGAFMRTSSGDVVTQYDLHDAEAAGMTKYDFLVTSVQDKITTTIDLLKSQGEIESNLSLREIYNKYLHPAVLPIEDKKIWSEIQQVNILDLFQFDSEVGSQAAKKIKPTSIFELSDANGLMRLMTAEKGAEMPIDKYCRFKKNIQLWYDEMDSYGLTKEEQEILKPHFLRSHGVPPSQEQMMTMLMDENICGFSLKDANTARKIVGKKQMSKIPKLKEQVMRQAKRPELGRYVWECGIGYQMGYAFSIIHALAYSFIGFQTAYLATNWNPIYWDTACLIVNSESLEEENVNEDDEEAKKKLKNANYDKIAKAIGNIKDKGIKVSLININTSDYGFKPDVENNRILYGLKALGAINPEIIEMIKAGRPYAGIKDFISKCKLGKTAMVNLIKSGAFDEIDEDFCGDRRKIMAYYLMISSKPKERITMQNFAGLINYNLLPKELELQIRVFNFNKFLKANKKVGKYYVFDEVCLNFFNNFLKDNLEILQIVNGVPCTLQSDWDNVYKSYMVPAKEWIIEHQEEMLKSLNMALFKEQWEKYAKGNISHWEIEAICFYYHKHELINVNKEKYGISNFFDLPSEPEVDYFFTRGKNQIPIFKLTRIIGTVIAKNDPRSTVTILTVDGVVNVKFTKEYYTMFKRQISEVLPSGKKKVIEKGWFSRGVKIMVQGFRREDTFVTKNYKNSGGHQLYKITEVIGQDILLQHERMTSSNTIEEDEYEQY